MTTPGGGGDRLEVPVVVDATGAAKGLQREVDERVKHVRARIKAEVDSKRLEAQAAAAAKRVERVTKTSLKLGVDSRYLKESIRGALAQIGNEWRIKLAVDVDTGKVEAELDRLSRSGSATVDVDIDADSESVEDATDDVDELGRSAKRTGKEAARALGSLSKIGLVAGGVQMLTSAVTALGGGLIAVAGAASQAVGALAALPNLAGIAVQAGGALLAGFSGVGAAVTAMGKPAGGGGGGGGAAAAKAQEAAQRRIADARQRVADVTEQAARRVQRAEEALAASQVRVQRAQEQLNRAREQARERLEDYQLSLKGAALDEEAATLAVERARERWNETMRSPVSTELDRAEADLALRQAELRLEEVKESRDDLTKETDAAFKAGIEGAAEVVGAQEDLADANKDVADAERELAEERRDATRDLADAQRDLADAIAEAADAGAGAAGGGINALADAMDKLSPAGRAFAQFINDVLKPRLLDFRNAIQQALLPAVQDAIELLITTPPGGQSFLDVVQEGMVGTADELGKIATKAAELMASDLFKSNTAEIMASNNRALASFGDAGVHTLAILSDIAVAVGPLVEEFADWTAELTKGWRETVRANAESGKLAAFFERAGDRAKQLGNIVGNLGRTLFNLGKAGTETGDGLLDKFEALTERMERWTGSDAGQARLREFFETIGPLVEEIATTVGLLAEAFVLMGENGGGALTGFLWVINGVLTVLNYLLASPIGPFVSALLTLAGVAGGIGFLASMVLRMVANVRLISGLLGPIGRFALSAVTTAAKWALAAARVIGSWALMAVQATVHALRVAAVWLAQTLATGITIAASWAATTARVVAGWVLMGAQAMAQALRMAAAWFIALGPLGWVIAAVIGIAALIWANWENVKKWTVNAFRAVTDAVRGAINWVRQNWPLLLAILTGPIGLAVYFIVRHWDEIKEAARRAFSFIGSFVSGIWRGLGNGLRAAINGILGVLNRGIGGMNRIIGGVNRIPGVDLPTIPTIPLLAEGGIITRPTLAVVGEDGPEAVIPLSRGRADRRAELLRQMGMDGMAALGNANTPADLAALGGWGPIDAAAGSRPLASVVAAGAQTEHRPASSVGTVIEEGAIVQHIVNPVPETAAETLNARLRRLASVGIFDSKPGS